jgi:dTDP-4-dehydrorhamnose reductase
MVGAAEEMSRRIVVTGAAGRLGSALVREWRAVGEDVIGLARPEFDLGSPEQIRAALEPLDFGVLVNCAAQTNVDRCETHPEEATALNADAVRIMAGICATKGARLIQISTDYVFDGAKQTPYTEEDAAEPISHYGESKRAGEIAALETSERNLVARVSWVFGPDRPSFVDSILERARTEANIAAVADKIAVPTYSLDAALLLRPLLFDIPTGGVVHLCNAGSCTWQEYGQHALDCAIAAGDQLKATTVDPQKMSDIKAFIARRPPNTAMATEKLARLTGTVPREWREAVREYVTAEISKRSRS